MQKTYDLIDGKGKGPLDLIAEDRKRGIKPGTHQSRPRYSPLREHVSQVRFAGMNDLAAMVLCALFPFKNNLNG